MNKEMFIIYESLIRDHIRSIYIKACAVTGERKNAEELVKDAILYGAKKFSGLSNKTHVLKIIIERIGEGNSAFFEECDYEELLAIVMMHLKLREQRQNRIKLTFVIALAVVACVGIMLIFIRQTSDISDDKSLMKNTDVIQGDNSLIKFINYQNLSARLNKKGEPDKDKSRRVVTLERMASVVTAPDGTLYAAYHNWENEDGGENTFTLYQGGESGWVPVGSGAITAEEVLTVKQYDIWTFLPSEIFVVADEASNAYVISRLDHDVTIHKFDKEKETFEKTAVIPFTYIDYYRHLSVKYDGEYGENGTIYIACNDAGQVKIYYYDIETDKVNIFANNIPLALSTGKLDFCVKNHTIHMYESGSFGVWYYRVSPDGSCNKKQLHKVEAFAETMNGIEIDANNTVHILTREKEVSGRTGNVVHYMIFEDDREVRAELEPLYYDESSYIAGLIGMFVGNDGNIYYLEHYQSFIALGKMDSADAEVSTYMEGFEILDYCSLFYMEGKDILLHTYDANYENRQIISFHIAESTP